MRIHAERARARWPRPAAGMAALALCLGAAAATAELHRYVDDSGRVRFTNNLDTVPEQYRGQLENIETELRDRSTVNVISSLTAPVKDDPAAKGKKPAAPPPSETLSLGTMVRNPAAGAQTIAASGPVAVAGMVLALPIWLLRSAGVFLLACKLAAPKMPGFGKAAAVVAVQIPAAGAAGALAGLLIGALFTGPSGPEGLFPFFTVAAVVLATLAGVVVWLVEVRFAEGLAIVIVHQLLSVFLVGAPLFAVTTLLL
jgi:hypothetical protein